MSWHGVERGDEARGDLDRRVANGVRKGVIEEVDHARGLARVRIGRLLTGWLPWITGAQNARRRVWDPRQTGEQVVVSSPSGDLAQGVIGGSLSTVSAPQVGDRGDLFREEFADGHVSEYDMETKTRTINVPAGGKLVFVVGRTRMTLSDDGIVVVTPDADWTVG